MSILFESIKLGDLTLKNRIVMSPMTRSRAGKERIANELMAKYYSQRADVGLIISEATSVDPMGEGYPDTPGIYNDKQVEGWKLVTNAVHKKNGLIFLQMWHVGRMSDPMYLNGATPVAPSAIGPKQGSAFVPLTNPPKPVGIPRELSTEEIKQIVQRFIQGAKNAKNAGFDGVEIHGANGYLLDQFLQDSSNKRTDEYGGSLENRMRFPLQVLDGVLSVWDKNRVGYHIAPRCDAFGMGDSDSLATFSVLVEQINKRQIAFICSREKLGLDSKLDHLRKIFNGIYIANESFDKNMAEKLLNEQRADMVAFGKPILANPDFVTRIKMDAKLNKADEKTFYALVGEIGYTDYPYLDFGI